MSKNRKQKQYKDNNHSQINYAPKTAKQAELFHALEHKDLLVVLGAAGTGKTYTCCIKAALWLLKNKIDKIVLARANVPTGRSLGAIKGGLEEKLEPWLMPMTDVLRKTLGGTHYDLCVKRGKIVPVALESIRGRSFDNSFILIDECQQLTIEEIKAITTRVGEGSVLCLMGDPAQTDLKAGSGIKTFLDLIQKEMPENVYLITFGLDDIVRSDTCAAMVRMFYKAGL